jgi:hypothetical protein
MYDNFVISNKLLKANNRPLGENSPNLVTLLPRDRCYESKNIFAETFGENIGIFSQTSANFCKNLITTLFFFRKTPNFSQKVAIITSTPGWRGIFWCFSVYFPSLFR